MEGRLVYVVGASGVGKDSLLNYARGHLPPDAGVRFAQRWITRPANAGGEAHRPLSAEEFARMQAAGRFAMAWRANGNAYGIDSEIRTWLGEGQTVVVSGSREYLPRALQDFPQLVVVNITADPALLPGRLERRAREVPVEIERRLKRGSQFGGPQFAIPLGVKAVEIRNDGAPEVAGAALLSVLSGSAPV